MQDLFTLDKSCPYCGEAIELLIDSSFYPSQDYVEDCFVCCCPINISVEFIGDEPSVILRHENES